ncbi:uncharacterized protein LOC122847744 [Aphidius gifuensis]|uniref:uncharacterized protein LOC122847744 n=1 Tax=Aphidius gifuensis TaxID=684658 RepID=UPI001CDBAA06|nr:uncharacterized protein LOC122847744 [Aphidius gifuensis]
MSSKRICVEKNQATSDESDKDQKVVITSLDYDVLAKIIMLLPIPERIDMEKVCAEWKEACQLAWYDIKKYKCESSIGRCYDNRLMTQSYLEKILLRCGNYLKELSLSNVCNSSIMPFVGDHCKNLTILECKFDDNSLINNADHFVQAFTQLDKLKSIKITVIHNYTNKTINLSAIIDSLPEDINEIHLFAEPLSDRKQNISMTLQRFKNLRKLTSVGLCLDQMNFQEIEDMTTLVHLDIGLYDIYERFFLFNKLFNLEYIDLTMGIDYDANNLSTEVLETIFHTCDNLKHLDLPRGLYDLDEISHDNWINFQNLEYLGIYCDIMPDLANTIVENCRNLKHLKIKSQNTINTALENFTELENLESIILDGVTELYEESIIAISNDCKKLKRLEIPYCYILPSIDGDSFSSQSVLDELSKLRYLEHLSFHTALELEDSTIIAIANNCKNLKSLNIKGCRGLTKTALDALTNLKNLQILDVGILHTVTDSFLIKLKGFKRIYCDECDNLTDAGIIQFIKNNPDLEMISIFYIGRITDHLIIGADQATKNRTNGIILHITECSESLIEASKSIITSQWLVVE